MWALMCARLSHDCACRLARNKLAHRRPWWQGGLTLDAAAALPDVLEMSQRDFNRRACDVLSVLSLPAADSRTNLRELEPFGSMKGLGECEGGAGEASSSTDSSPAPPRGTRASAQAASPELAGGCTRRLHELAGGSLAAGTGLRTPRAIGAGRGRPRGWGQGPLRAAAPAPRLRVQRGPMAVGAGLRILV